METSKQRERVSMTTEAVHLNGLEGKHNGSLHDSKKDEVALSSSEKDAKNIQAESDQTEERYYLSGWRLHVLTFSLCLALFLSTIETTIVSTALVSISNALHDFHRSGWIVTSYMLTYTGFLTVFAKLGDIFGRKSILLIAIAIFTIFSAACGASQNMLQLIILRAFQGLGASGIYSLVGILAVEVAPLDKAANIVALISATFAVSSVLGPILGGFISEKTTWRWVFLLNLPGGAVAITMVFIFLPYTWTKRRPQFWKISEKFDRSAFKRMDYLGAFLSVVASILMVFGIQQGGTQYPWKSAPIISTLVLSGIFWIGFALWERQLESRDTKQEAVLPWRILSKRKEAGMLLTAFLTGFPFMGLVFNLPVRFQVVNNLSATQAGYRMLPFLLSSPVGSALTGVLATKLRYPAIYVTFSGLAIQLIGISLLTTLNTDIEFPKAVYAYEVLLGIGFGLLLTSLLVMVPLYYEKRDRAVGISAVTQVRVFGGTIGVAICTMVLHSYMRTHLKEILTADQMASVLKSTNSILTFPIEKQLEVRRVIGDAFGVQVKVLTAFTAASFFSCLMIMEKNPRRADENTY